MPADFSISASESKNFNFSRAATFRPTDDLPVPIKPNKYKFGRYNVFSGRFVIFSQYWQNTIWGKFIQTPKGKKLCRQAATNLQQTFITVPKLKELLHLQFLHRKFSLSRYSSQNATLFLPAIAKQRK